MESQIHRQIDLLTDLRIRQNREFFNVQPETAFKILKDIAKLLDDVKLEEVHLKRKQVDITDEDEIVEITKTRGKDKVKRKVTRPWFKFSMIGINIGETITFTPTNTQVKVASDNKIEYKGRLYMLSPFVAEFMPESRKIPSGSFSGSRHFTYKGKTLENLRKELEKQQENNHPNEE